MRAQAIVRVTSWLKAKVILRKCLSPDAARSIIGGSWFGNSHKPRRSRHTAPLP